MIRRRSVIAGAVFTAGIMLGVLIPAGAAQAQATVFSFSDTHTDTFTGPLEGCLPPDLIGTSTLTETATGQVVDTGKNVVNIHGVSNYDLHVDFPNGIYVQSGLNRDIFSLHFHPPLTVQHVATQEFRTIYAADGTPIGTLTIHGGYHITYRDTNGNGEADPGEITAQFDHFRLTCG